MRENKECKIYNMIIIGWWMNKDILIMSQESGGKIGKGLLSWVNAVHTVENVFKPLTTKITLKK